MHAFATSLAAAILVSSATQDVAQMTQDQIRQGYKEHAALAQFYRWYQYYERPEGGISNALDILTDDVVVESGLGTAIGHAEYQARVLQLPNTWSNAHHVKSTEFEHGEDGAMTLAAQITYQNTGILPHGAVRQADLDYTIELVPGQTVLPRLSKVLIEQASDETVESFEDAYAENRMRSLVHYWLALIEDPARNPEPVREILADAFSLNFSSGAITDFEGFKAWLAGPGSQVVASTHVIEGFSVEEKRDHNFQVTMTFSWAGLTPDGTELVAMTKHTWSVENDLRERFARIKTIDVEVLEPFRPKDN